MHIMKECILDFKIAFAVQKNSIYKEAFNKKMLQLIESGLTKKYLIDEKEKIGKEAKWHWTDDFKDVQSLKVDHMNAIFILFVILLCSSCLCFAFEIFIGIWTKRRIDTIRQQKE